MSKTIEIMPDEVKDRFKALKVLYVSLPHHLIFTYSDMNEFIIKAN